MSDAPANPKSATDAFLRSAEAYASGFRHGELTSPPRQKTVVVTCMDARIDPAKVLGLSEGDAHVLRNAGGLVTDDVIRSLAVSQHLLGTTEIMVMMHTGCGMHQLDDGAFGSALEVASGQRPDWTPGGFPDLDGEVRRSLETIRSSPFIPHGGARGFVYDVRTGRVREIH